MKPIYLLYIAFILFAASCKEGTSVEKEETVGETTANPPAGQTVQPNAPSGGHDQTFLTDKLFHYKTAAIVGKDNKQNPYENQWIDFDPNGTYKSGTLKEQTHTGKWDFNVDQKILLLRPDVNTFKITEWKVMHNNDIVILVGTQTYGNNATQIQLVRNAELP